MMAYIGICCSHHFFLVHGLYLFVTSLCFLCFFFNDTATTEIYTLSLHDALPILAMMTVPTLNNVMGGKGSPARIRKVAVEDLMKREAVTLDDAGLHELLTNQVVMVTGDRKSTRLNSSHT